MCNRVLINRKMNKNKMVQLCIYYQWSCMWPQFSNHYRLLNIFHLLKCAQVRIARIFNTYGPRMCLDDGRVVSNFVAQVCLSHIWVLFSIAMGYCTFKHHSGSTCRRYVDNQ